jgi:hypothetical protein
MSAIPAGALPQNEVALVPKRLLKDILELLSRGGPYPDVGPNRTDIEVEIQDILTPKNATYRKKR